MTSSVGSPYPGFDKTGNYNEPHAAPRVRPEAEEFAAKHKGSINLFNSDKHTHVIAPPPSPRCQTGEARQNYEAAKGLVGGLLGGKGPRPAPEARPAPRVNSQSEDIAEAHKGGPMNNLLTNYGNNRASPRPNPRVKQEAEETSEKSKGGRMNNLMHAPSALPSSPRSAPRVKPEAEEIASKGQGAGMSKIMGRYGENTSSARGVPRVKPEAEATAMAGQGGAMNSLFTKYGHLPQSARPEPRVKEGKGIANLDKGVRITKMIHGGGLPNEPAPPPRAASSAGRRNIKKARGNIGNIFAETSKWQMCPSVQGKIQ